MKKEILPLGKVEKCKPVRMIDKGVNPEFYEYALIPFPKDEEVDGVYLKTQDHWFPLQTIMVCYDSEGNPVLAVEKQEHNDLEFGYSKKVKDEDSDKTS